MKKADMILGVIVILVSLSLFLIRSLFQGAGAYIEVRIDGEYYGTYALDEDQEIAVGSGNTVVIEDGRARMTEADCPDHLCVRQGRISRDGEMIVCLPNRVTVQVCDEQSEEIVPDAIAG